MKVSDMPAQEGLIIFCLIAAAFYPLLRRVLSNGPWCVLLSSVLALGVVTAIAAVLAPDISDAHYWLQFAWYLGPIFLVACFMSLLLQGKAMLRTKAKHSSISSDAAQSERHESASSVE
jgi:predicted membrane channel-forming protein YqfA (hemolysin III family)